MTDLYPLRIVTAVLLGLGVSAAANAQTGTAGCRLDPAPGVSEQTSDQIRRPFRLFLPEAHSGPMALVLDLHGSGGNAEGQARTSRFETIAAREGFAVATLEASEGRRWNVPVTADRADDVAYVSDVISSVGERACLDAGRVYATGFSGGARMTSLLGCRLNDRIAAIAPVAGLRWTDGCGDRPIPVLTFHGLADPQNPYDGHAEGRGAEWLESVPEALASWAAHNECAPDLVFEDPAGPLWTMRYAGCAGGAEVELIRIDGLGHTWPREEVDATAVMWAFFARHRLP